MAFIVFDLECTCWDDGKNHRDEMEVTEIGAVAVSDLRKLVDPSLSLDALGMYDMIVRPLWHPQLSEFATGLTGITQRMVDSAPSLGFVWPHFMNWCRQFNSPPGSAPIFVSWGMFDRLHLERECKRKGIDLDLLTPKTHFSAKHRWAKVKGERQEHDWEQRSLEATLTHLGLVFKGRQHRGIDDAINIVDIFDKIWVDVVRDYKNVPVLF